jgi:hypothetical protein
MNVAPRDILWTGTGGVSDVQSYPWIILNGIYDRLAAASYFQGWVKRITSALPIEAGLQIPFLGIFLTQDDGGPDGDGNAGDIRFSHNFTVGFQIVVKNNDSTAMLKTLDQAYWFAVNQLLHDNSLTNRLNTTLPDGVTIESYPRLRVRMPDVWGLAGIAKNETPFGERLFYLTMQLRTCFFPNVFPDLERISVTTAFPFGGDDAAQAAVEQIKIVYEFTPDSVPTPLPPDLTLASISPTTAVHGTATVITATGTDFDSTCKICADGLSQATTFISPTQLEATIPGTFLAGSYSITIQNNSGGVTAPQTLVLT